MLKLFSGLFGLACVLVALAFQAPTAVAAPSLNPDIPAGISIENSEVFSITVDLSQTTEVTVSMEELDVFDLHLKTNTPITGTVTYGGLDCGSVFFVDNLTFAFQQETIIPLRGIHPNFTILQVFINTPEGMVRRATIYIVLSSKTLPSSA